MQRLFSTALLSSGSHPPCHTGLKCWCPFPAETYSVRSFCTSLQASLCPGTRWHGEICAQSERYTSDRNSNSRLSILPRESQRTSVCSSSCVCSAPMFSRKKFPLIIQLLNKTIEDIPPEYLYLMILLPFRDFRSEKSVLQANRTLKFQVLRSNPLLADFKLQ